MAGERVGKGRVLGVDEHMTFPDLCQYNMEYYEKKVEMRPSGDIARPGDIHFWRSQVRLAMRQPMTASLPREMSPREAPSFQKAPVQVKLILLVRISGDPGGQWCLFEVP